MDKWLNATTGHAILGGLLVLVFSPLFVRLGFPGYLIVLAIPLNVAILKEVGDARQWWPHEPSNFKQALGDVAEWFFGGCFFALFVGLAKFLT